ncbi:unnamed protein product [Rhodiola kirilowii]
MDENSYDNAYLMERIRQLEHERSELRKDIEQLCMQQAGPGYLAVATRMHFQRTASLEQEVETLKKRLDTYARDKTNLQEELSEAYRIKSQLADLHGAEVLKNIEAEKQLKFFQGCVAAAFSERDNSLMEAEKAKEKEELMSRKINDYQKRIEELTKDCLEQRKLTDSLSSELTKKGDLDKTLKEIVNKFYQIRQHSSDGVEDISWHDKCECLMNDSAQMWSFSEDMNKSTNRYISALEGELEASRKTVLRLQSKLQMGLEIESHLKKVYEQEKKKNLSIESIKSGVAGLCSYHSQQKAQIMELLDVEKSYVRSIVDALNGKIRATSMRREHTLDPPERDVPLDDECRDVHMSSDPGTTPSSESKEPCLAQMAADGVGDISKVLALALQEKVAALLLLSQQEERHLLERNINAALQRKIDELQQSLLQVTNEKVKALMELARVKQENQVFYERISDLMQQEKHSGSAEEIVSMRSVGGGGRLKSLLKKTYLSQWIGHVQSLGSAAEAPQPDEKNAPKMQPNNKLDYARMKIENATLRESMGSLEHLTSSVHRHRVSLMKVNESLKDKTTENDLLKIIEDIITDANTLKTAFGSSLPVSWSADSDMEVFQETTYDDPHRDAGDSSKDKLDTVAAAAFEMFELLLLAAQKLHGELAAN